MRATAESRTARNELTAAREPGAVGAARGLAPLVAECAAEAEVTRELPERLVGAMAEAGLFSIWVPTALGGQGLGFQNLVDVVIEVARIDGSAGWVLFVHAVYGALAAYLDEQAARVIYTSSARVSGTLNPTGRAVPVDGGYLVNGRWTFGSGVSHATWVLGNCMVVSEDSQGPRALIALFPRDKCTVHDTWRVSGLAGTGSHDYGVADLFVPTIHTFPAFTAPPHQPGALYATPFITLFAATVAAPALGMARGAIDATLELATRKTPTGSSSLLRDRPSAQAALARAEGLFQAGRAGLIEGVNQLIEKAGRGEVSLHDRALVRIAAAHSAASAVEAVDLAFEVAGSTANELDSPLQRFSRDVRAATQHIAVVPNNFEIAGRVLVGLEPGTPRF